MIALLASTFLAVVTAHPAPGQSVTIVTQEDRIQEADKICKKMLVDLSTYSRDSDGWAGLIEYMRLRQMNENKSEKELRLKVESFMARMPLVTNGVESTAASGKSNGNQTKSVWKEFLLELAQVDFSAGGNKFISLLNGLQLEKIRYRIPERNIRIWKSIGIIHEGRLNLDLTPEQLASNIRLVGESYQPPLNPIVQWRHTDGFDSSEIFADAVLSGTVLLDDLHPILFHTVDLIDKETRPLFLLAEEFLLWETWSENSSADVRRSSSVARAIILAYFEGDTFGNDDRLWGPFAIYYPFTRKPNEIIHSTKDWMTVIHALKSSPDKLGRYLKSGLPPSYEDHRQFIGLLTYYEVKATKWISKLPPKDADREKLTRFKNNVISERRALIERVGKTLEAEIDEDPSLWKTFVIRFLLRRL